MKRIILNETAYFGSESRFALKDELIKRKFKKALVITDGILKDILLNKVTDILDEMNFSYEVFTNVKANPTITNVLDGLEVCKSSDADVIIALGGGSVIDCSKAIAIIKTNPEYGDVRSLEGVVNTKNRCLPIIALPTTAGTAAEVTINYVITDEENETKMVCVDPNDLPVLAIVDTDFLMTMPKSVVAATGMDALTHAIEGYITKGANEISDMFHLQAIKMIYANLYDAANGSVDAMEQMGMAQYIAGMGFSNVGLGIVHSMAHPLGALYDTPHGVANALLLPYVLEYNGVGLEDKFLQIAKCFNLDTTDDCLSDVVNAIRELSISLNIPQKLSEINVLESDFDTLAKKAYSDPCTGGNPRQVSVEIIKELYENAF